MLPSLRGARYGRNVLRAFLDGRVYGNQRGEDPPFVVALHGWQRNNSDFDAVLSSKNPAIDDPFHGEVIASLALDLPGFGDSPAPPSAWGSAEYARSLLPIFAALPATVVLLGHSFGGRVALHLATMAPQQIRGLVLTGVPIGAHSPQTRPRANPRYRLIRRAAALGIVSGAQLERARQRYGSRDYREATGVMRQVLVATVQESYESLYPQIAMPVELVWGENDTAAPVSAAKQIVGEFPDARLTVVDHTGHLLPTESPEALRRALAKWR
jgi:pimeloyl-ACP methyl ester carboxylesterase